MCTVHDGCKRFQEVTRQHWRAVTGERNLTGRECTGVERQRPGGRCRHVCQLVGVIKLGLVFLLAAVCHAPLSAGCNPRHERPQRFVSWSAGVADGRPGGSRRLRLRGLQLDLMVVAKAPRVYTDGHKPPPEQQLRSAGLRTRLRGGGHVLASPLWGHHQTVGHLEGERQLTVSTFNVLCPLFRRVPRNHSAAEAQPATGASSLCATDLALTHEGLFYLGVDGLLSRGIDSSGESMTRELCGNVDRQKGLGTRTGTGKGEDGTGECLP